MDKEAVMQEYMKQCALLSEAVNSALEKVPALFLQHAVAELAQGVAALAARQTAQSMEAADV